MRMASDLLFKADSDKVLQLPTALLADHHQRPGWQQNTQ